MSLIWRKANGDIRRAVSGVPELVRAWTYRCVWSDCFGLITIIGCEPPECVRFKNTNVNESWFPYARGACGAWSGSGGYAWPDDVPDCPYPDGISIEAIECPEVKVVELKVAITGPLCKIWWTCCYEANDRCSVCDPIDMTGCTDGHGGLGWPRGSAECVPTGTLNLTRSGSGWAGNVAAGECYYDYLCSAGYSVNINCDGSISFLGASSAGIRISECQWGGSGSIALDAEYLPIGSDSFDVYGWANGGNQWCYTLAGTLNLTVSKQ